MRAARAPRVRARASGHPGHMQLKLTVKIQLTTRNTAVKVPTLEPNSKVSSRTLIAHTVAQGLEAATCQAAPELGANHPRTPTQAHPRPPPRAFTLQTGKQRRVPAKPRRWRRTAQPPTRPRQRPQASPPRCSATTPSHK